MADSVSIRGRRSPSRHLRDEHSFGAFGRFRARPSGGLAFGRSGTQDATPLAPLPLEDQWGRMGRCEKEPAVILVRDQAQADLGGPELTCPHCPVRLRRWGFARARWLRSSGGGRVWLRPRRVRCASCRVSHVLLPALAPPHRAYTIDLVGQALLA